MDYKDYQSFCVERSHTDLDEISFRLLRAASGFAAEIQEYMSETDVDKILDEFGDVLFWAVTLDYWLTKLDVPSQPNITIPNGMLEGAVFILDCVEKYSRNKNIQKLVPVRVLIDYLIDEVVGTRTEEHQFDALSTRNYNKLISVKPRVSTTGV